MGRARTFCGKEYLFQGQGYSWVWCQDQGQGSKLGGMTHNVLVSNIDINEKSKPKQSEMQAH